MQDHPVLGQVALGYSPMIDRQRAVVATRLTVFPERPEGVDAAALMDVLAEAWPRPEGAAPLKLTLRPLDPGRATPAGAAAPGHPDAPVALNLAGEQLLASAMAASPGPQLMLEVPAFMAGEARLVPELQRLRANGSVLLIKGRPLAALPSEVLPCFSHAIVDDAQERRGPSAEAANPLRQISTIQAGVRDEAGVKAAFERGSVAVLGWPFGDEPVAGGPARPRTAVDVQAVMELMDGVERERPVPQLEAILKRDPTLAFRLMRYLNSAAFGLRVEITTFQHALMMLGYQRLKRWLALLLASSAKGQNARPLMFAAVRRGLLMEELGKLQAGSDNEVRGEMFVCGVFSLLDRLLQQPMRELLGSLPVPERVVQALSGDGGPYLPQLELVRAIEQESAYDIREARERLMLGPREANRALLAALATARQLD
jgi:EAL and modified HD-GYP domain-containing signal transduction protein